MKAVALALSLAAFSLSQLASAQPYRKYPALIAIEDGLLI